MFEPRQRNSHAVLALTVRNHPGVMSHICGLFSRRAYNLEGILCMPIGDGSRSRMWLRVNDRARLEQILKQLRTLEDVLEVECAGVTGEMADRVAAYLRMP